MAGLTRPSVCPQSPVHIGGRGPRRFAQVCRVQMEVQLQTGPEPHFQGPEARHRLPGQNPTSVCSSSLYSDDLAALC